LSEVGDADSINETGKRLLHNVFDHIGDRDEERSECQDDDYSLAVDLRVNHSPNELDQTVQPLDTFGHRW
jgi:hypothetical protein